jgi:protein involved in polysaccharide export with SLBB domain
LNSEGSNFQQGKGSESEDENIRAMSWQRPAMLDVNAYQIHILGMVSNPGTYRLPPSTRMAEAIEMAGGVNSRGSYRLIELRRNHRTIKTYDLTAFLQGGQLSQNPFLLDNDTIFVPFNQRVVSVQGPVNRVGVIELIRENTLLDIVRLVGGFTVGILMTDPVTLIRYENGQKAVYKVPLVDAEMAEFGIQNGDVIVFPHVLTKGRKFDYNVARLPNDNIFYPSYNDNVFIMGAVAQPGAYKFSPFYDIRQYVNMAGPMRYAAFKRIKILDINGKEIKNRIGFQVSPGDTIVVPFRAWTMDNVLKWYNTISSTIFTGFALQQLIKSQ